MGGIAGIFHAQLPKPVDPARVEAMTAMLAHRGPDGAGIWTAPGVGLGHRRLAIVDRSDAAAQPMVSADGRYAITCDGEIYNFRELRAELVAKGHALRTESDTETLLAGWRQWGPDCLARMDGAFAFALYDATAGTLFLARDRLGIKPLFYAELSDGALLFASELKGLLVHPRLRRSPSPQAVEDYLALGYVPDDASIVEGVRKLPAGHHLLACRGRAVPRPVRWWDVDFTSPRRAPARLLEEELTEHLRAAVRSRMAGDLPLGVLLSGGVDSSAVVAFMAEASRKAVVTCSIGFGQADHDPTSPSARVAELFATRHRTRSVDADDFSLIDILAAAFDEPFGDAAALAALRVSALAGEEVKVALAGDGADETLAGHPHYRLFAAEERVRGWLPGPVAQAFGALGRLPPGLDRWPLVLRARTSLQGLARGSGEAYGLAVCATSPDVRSRLYSADFKLNLQSHRAEDRYSRIFADAPAVDALSRAQYADLAIRLPGDMLTRADRAGMAFGLGVREPWLDHRLVEFAARLPVRMRLRGGVGKWLLKRALRERLPAEILDRPGRGLVPPVSDWFRGPLSVRAELVAHGSALAETGWFDSAVIAGLADDHRRGQADHGLLLWQLVMLERSLQRVFALGPAKAPRRQPGRSRAKRAAG